MAEAETQKIDFSSIRRDFDETNSKWYFSVVDVIAVNNLSTNPRNYWKVLKNRLKKAQNELVTRCNQLKLEAADGKFYLTDVADVDTMVEIVKILAPKNLLSFKAWALGLGTPKNAKTAPPFARKMRDEIAFKNKKESYPQVTYNVANLINKSFNTPIEKIRKEDDKKTPKRIRMGTI